MAEALNCHTAIDMPERYRRNLGTIGAEGQAKLMKSRVAVVGAGGLGGLVIELLARMGVGLIVVIDGDTFHPHNLNRQLLATEQNLGAGKAAAAAQRVALVNSTVELKVVDRMLTAENARELLSGVDIIVDALDNIQTRLLLGEVAAELNVPLVHAAIAGFTGQVASFFPGDKGMAALYGRMQAGERGIERELGNPAATPALAASLQVSEVIKILTGIGKPLRGKLLYFDTEFNTFETFELA